MSPLSSRHLELAIWPDALRLRICKGWRRSAAVTEVENTWAPAQPLHEALEGLLALARSAHAGADLRGCPVDVEIGNALAHFDVVQGDFAGQSDMALTSIAGACVQELLGPGHGRETRWQLQSDERHLLVCAIDGKLLAAVRAAASERALPLRRIETSFGIDWNRHGKRVAGGIGVFVSRGADEATSAFVRDGIVEALSSCLQPDGFDQDTQAAPAIDGHHHSIDLRAMAAPTRLDAQVGRMVGSVGVAMDEIERFVAVVDRDVHDAMSSRWDVRIEREATG